MILIKCNIMSSEIFCYKIEKNNESDTDTESVKSIKNEIEYPSDEEINKGYTFIHKVNRKKKKLRKPIVTPKEEFIPD